MEITGGSLGHGLGTAVGMVMGLKRKNNPAFVFNLMSDGELGEGSTWEAVMPGVQHRLDLAPCQAAGERNAHRIPLELVALCRCPAKSP